MIEILAGVVSGIVSGTGMGGGTILILILSMFMGIEQHVAQATNLVFFVPTAIAAIAINIKNKNIEWKTAGIIIFFGIIGAVIGAKASNVISSERLRRYFGFFLAAIAIHEIYFLTKEYISNKKKT